MSKRTSAWNARMRVSRLLFRDLDIVSDFVLGISCFHFTTPILAYAHPGDHLRHGRADDRHREPVLGRRARGGGAVREAGAGRDARADDGAVADRLDAGVRDGAG